MPDRLRPRARAVAAMAFLGLLLLNPAAPRAQPPAAAIHAEGEKAERLVQAGRAAEAVPVAERAAQMARRGFGPTDDKTVALMKRLATVYQAAGRTADAVGVLQQAVDILEKTEGPNSPMLLRELGNLGWMRLIDGKHLDAERVLRRALKILDAQPGGGDPAALVNTLRGLAQFEQFTGRNGDAEKHARRALEIAEAKRPPGDAATVAVRALLATMRGPGDGGGGDEGSLLRAVADREARHGPDHPETAGARGQLGVFHVIRGEYAKAEPQLTRALDKGPRRELEWLAAREHELPRQLAQAVHAPLPTDSWVEVDAVRAALPADAVLVEFARVMVPKGRAAEVNAGVSGGKPARAVYAARVIPAAGAGDLRLVRPGTTEPIDVAVAAARRAMQPDPRHFLSIGEAVRGGRLVESAARPKSVALQPTEAMATAARFEDHLVVEGLFSGSLRPSRAPARWTLGAPDTGLRKGVTK